MVWMTSDLYPHNYIDYCGNNNKKQMYLVSVSTPFMWSGSLHWVLIQDFCLTRKLELSQMWCFVFILWGGSRWMAEQTKAINAILDVSLNIAPQYHWVSHPAGLPNLPSLRCHCQRSWAYFLSIENICAVKMAMESSRASLGFSYQLFVPRARSVGFFLWT